jgi:hypothetical protein
MGATRLDATGLGDAPAFAHVAISAFGGASLRSIRLASMCWVFFALIGFSTLSSGSKSRFGNRKIRAAFRRGFDTINLDHAERQQKQSSSAGAPK